MKTILNPAQKDWSSILQRPTKTVDDIEATVNQVFGDVQKNGDTAVNKYTQLFDGVTLANNLVSSSEIEEAKKLISSELKEAIITAQKKHYCFSFSAKNNKSFCRNYKWSRVLARKTTNSKSWFIYSWWYSSFIFNSVNVGNTCTNCRL